AFSARLSRRSKSEPCGADRYPVGCFAVPVEPASACGRRKASTRNRRPAGREADLHLRAPALGDNFFTQLAGRRFGQSGTACLATDPSLRPRKIRAATGPPGAARRPTAAALRITGA